MKRKLMPIMLVLLVLLSLNTTTLASELEGKLLSAAQNGQLEEVRTLLDAGAKGDLDLRR